MHTVGALCLQNGQDAIEYVDRTVDGIEIDEEHAEAVQVYLDAIRADKAARGGKLLIETPFQLDWLHPEFWGTCDCARLGSDNILTVYDAKFGRGVAVEVVKPDGRKNPQLSYYGLGAMEALRRMVQQLKIDAVEIVVVQPRAPHRDGPVRRVTITHPELLDLSQDLVDAAKAADDPNPAFKAGEWCKFCKAAGACRALRDFAVEAAQLDFDEDEGIMTPYGENTPNPLHMTAEQMRHALEAADVIKAWIAAVQVHAQHMANGGEVIPGWKLANKRATRKWRDEEATVSELSLVFGLDESSIFGRKLKTPAQIEKVLPKGDHEALAALYSKESSGTKLVRDTDWREGVEPSSQSDFDDRGLEQCSTPAEEW